MESLTYLKNIRITPKKLRFILSDIKKQKPAVALQKLMYSSSRPGRIMYQGLKSAITNAKNTLNIEDSLLQFKTLTIEEGQKIKRYQSGSRGTVKPILKRFSHIKIVLVGPEAASIKVDNKAAAKQDKKTEANQEVKVEEANPKAKKEVTSEKAVKKTKSTKKVSK